MKFYSIYDDEFKSYGAPLDIKTDEIIAAAENIEMPEEGSVYLPSVFEFESLSLKDEIQNEIYGEADVQLGYCCGHSSFLNALEWHKCSEVNIAVTDMVLLLGRIEELDNDGRFNSKNIKAFLLKRGDAAEIYSTTLHFCPCEVSEGGFGCIVGLLKGTNLPLDKQKKDKRLFGKNKWLIAHCDNAELIGRGAVSGIYGENPEVKK